MNRRMLLAGLAITPLAACAKAPGSFTPDPSTIDIVQSATVAARAFCGALPTADTIAKIALALALPAGLPAEQVASAIAHAFCDALPAARANAQVKRRIEPLTGRPIIDYGPAIINGKPVNITVYAQ